MRAHRVVVLSALGVLAIACVDIIGIKDIPDGAIADAAGDDGSDGGDTSVPACDPQKPFGAPTVVGGISSAGIAGIALSRDQKTAYICRATGNAPDPMFLSVATRGSTAGAFGSETTIAANARVCNVTTTMDERTIVWAQLDPPDSSNFPPEHLFTYTRTTTSAAFAFDAGTPLSGLNVRSEVGPYVRADGMKLYYFEDPGNASLIPKYTTADSGFQTAVGSPGLASGAYSIIVTSDDLVAYFNAPEIRVATRATPSDTFGNGSAVALPDAGLGQATPRLITDDRCTLYYTVNNANYAQDGSVTFSTALYMASKAP